MAHEMGHHIFQTVLNKKQRDFWRNAIQGDWGSLDLRDVLSKLKEGETLRDLEKRIERTEPVLHIQLETLLDQPRYKDLDLLGLNRIQQAIGSGRLDPVVKVPNTPITGYAGKNPEEAFCEVLGLLVGYGPRTVLPQARYWFSFLRPDVRIARLANRVAHRWLGR
jgi:hypothetical protein